MQGPVILHLLHAHVAGLPRVHSELLKMLDHAPAHQHRGQGVSFDAYFAQIVNDFIQK